MLRLKVLQVGKFYPPHKGGIETHLQALCGGLQHIVKLEVVVANDDNSASEEELDGISIARVPTLAVLASAPICPQMISKVRNSDADIVHLHLPNPMAVIAYLISGRRGPLVVSYHSDTVRQRILGKLFSPLLNTVLKRSSAIIVSSAQYRDSSPVLKNHISRCHIIPYGIELGMFETADPGAVATIRREHGDRLILSVGRLVYYKGFDWLIRSMSGVRGKLLIIGDGPLLSSLEQLVAELGVEHKVVFLRHISNDSMADYYHAADVFALASIARSEAFGIVQIEAMAAGIPVVNTRLDSGVPFVSLDAQTGITVPPGDSDALAGALNRLLDDEGLRRSYGAAAQKRARQEFSLNAMICRTTALYHGLAHK